MPLLGSAACNAVPVTALGDPTKVKEGSERVVLMPNGQKVKAICLNGEWILGSQALKFTTDTLPDPATLSPGVPVSVTTPYGENVATAVNGEFRYLLPFMTTWDEKPWCRSVPAGTELLVTDYANQKWVSDRIYWRPAQGRAIIAQQHGKANQPLATLSGITQGYFTIPGGNPIIKGGMIIYHSRVYIEVLTRKLGTGGPAGFHARLARVGAPSYPDATFATATLSNNNLQCNRFFSTANFGTSKTQFLTPQHLGPATGAVGSTVDKTSQINTDYDMEVTLSIASANVADSFELLSFAVWLEV